MAQSKKAYLIDGNSFCYRAYFAIRSLSNSKGFPTNAIYGFITMLRKLQETQSPDYLALTFDLEGPTFRHAIDETYKEHRDPMPDDLALQIPKIKEAVRAYGIPIFEKKGYEADDVLATLSGWLVKKDITVYIVTGDKDMLQLVNSKVKVMNPSKDNLIYNPARVRERFGVGPEKVADVMGLMGDAVDNIPGIPGFGEKTAVQLIRQFGSLEGVLNAGEKIQSDHKRQLVNEYADQARQSKQLATLDHHVPIKITMADFQPDDPDTEKLITLFKELEFSRLLKDLLPDSGSDNLQTRYHLVEGEDALKSLIKKMKKVTTLSVDTETTSEDPMRAALVGLSFSWKSGEAYYVPVTRRDDLFSVSPIRRKAGDQPGLFEEGTNNEALFRKNQKRSHDVETTLHLLRPILENPQIKKIGQNIKYDWIVLKRHGVNLNALFFDTMIASYLLNPSKNAHNLMQIALDHLGIKMIPTTDLIGKGKNQITMDRVEMERVSNYACADADIVWRLYGLLSKEIKEKELGNLLDTIEMPLIQVLGSMEMAGVAIDLKQLKTLSKKLEVSLKELTNEIYEATGTTFNINSPIQLRKILFEQLKLPVIKKTKTGPSTDVEVLEKLSSRHPIPKRLVTYRENTKLKSTYVDALPTMIHSQTGRIHTSFNQTVAATGRLSSSDPNLQNIPIRTPLGREIRKAFVAGLEDHQLVAADYSQIELRMLAHLSGDEVLTKAFQKGLDVHTHTASLVHGVKESEVTSSMRAIAKTVNFGIIYGLSAFGLSRTLKIDQAEAEGFIDAYFKRYPKVKTFIEEQIQFAREKGYVTTLFNRRRFIPEIHSAQITVRRFAERAATNTPVQGSAADLIKMAMLQVQEAIEKKGLKARMILQVHDELVFEVPDAEITQLKELVKNRMENAVRLKVPVVAEIAVGHNWLEVHR